LVRRPTPTVRGIGITAFSMTTTKSLRPHQQAAIFAVSTALRRSSKRISISMATGAGKLLVAAHIIVNFFKENRGARLWFVASSRSTLYQLNEILQKNPNLDEVIVIEDFTQLRIDIGTVALVTDQQLTTMDSPFRDNYFSTQPSLMFLFDCEQIGVGNLNSRLMSILPDLKGMVFIGLDSIIKRSRVFLGDPVYVYSFSEAMNDGLITPIRFIVPKNLRNDLNDDPEIDFVSDKTIEEIINLTNDQKTIIFCRNQEAAFTLSEQLNTYVVNPKHAAVYVSSVADDQLFPRFRDSEYPMILTTVERIIYEPPVPAVRNVVLFRKVNSENQLLQFLSVGLATNKDKTELKVIDYYDQSKIIVDAKDIILHISGSYSSESSADVSRQFFDKNTIVLRDKKSVDGVIGISDLAKEVAKLIVNMEKEQGRMLGIFGRWGRGKTFAMDKIWQELISLDKNYIRVDFHAWKYQDTPATWAYLFEQFANQYFKESSGKLNGVWRRLVLNISRIGWFELLYFLISFALSASISFGFSTQQKWEFVKNLVNIIPLSIVLNISILYFRFGKSAKSVLHKYFHRPDFIGLLGIQAEVQKELKHLMTSWKFVDKNFKLALFVDDIDRCSEEKIIQTVDSLRVLLEDESFNEHIIIIAAVDERVLRKAIELKYSNLAGSSNAKREFEPMIGEYIDKLFIFGIKLADLSVEERQEFFVELVKNDIELLKTAPVNEGNEVFTDVELPIDTEEDFKNLNTKVPEKRQTPRNVKVVGVQEGKLTFEESDLIKKALGNFVGATPRQIRIFYFRYLLTKSLLAIRYQNDRRENYWLNSTRIDLVLELILKFGWTEGPSSIAKHLAEINTDIDYTEVKLLQGQLISTRDYIQLLKVLDIVVAY